MIPIWYVFNHDGKYVEKYFEEEIAQRLVKEKNDALATTTIVGKWKLKKSQERVKTPFVEDLIKRYSRQEWGWTDSVEFRNEIRPKALALIKERRKSFQTDMGQTSGRAVDKQLLISALRELSTEERKELVSAMEKKGDAPMSPDEALAAAAKPQETYKKGYLQNMKADDLKEICNKLGLVISENSKKLEMVESIMKYQEEQAALTAVAPEPEPVSVT
jgi:hypothetical protein